MTQFFLQGYNLLGTESIWIFLLSLSERLVKLMDYFEGSFQDYTGHSDAVSTVRFSPDGKTLFSVSHDEIALWQVAL